MYVYARQPFKSGFYHGLIVDLPVLALQFFLVGRYLLYRMCTITQYFHCDGTSMHNRLHRVYNDHRMDICILNTKRTLNVEPSGDWLVILLYVGSIGL